MLHGLDEPTGNATMSRLLERLMAMLDGNMTSEIMALPPEERLRFLHSLESHYNGMKTHVGEEVLMQFVEYRIHKALCLYLPPVLLLMGIFGNVLSFLILRNKTMTRQSTNLFLAALAVADSMVLLVGLLRRWIGDMTGVDAQDEADWLCKTVSVMGYSSSQLSVWLIIAVTVERYFVVNHPLHATTFCNVQRAKRVIALLVSVFLLINMHLFWTVKIQKFVQNENTYSRCGPVEHLGYFIRIVWQWIDATLYALVPFVMIFIFNILIICQIFRSTSWRDAAQNGSLIKLEKRKFAKDNNLRLTVMLLSVSFTFLVTTFPMVIVMVYHASWNDQLQIASLQLSTQRRLTRTIADMLMYVNHSANFYLYCASGQKFRNQVIRTLCNRAQSNGSNASDHSQHLYCSRPCKLSGYHIHKSMDETAV